MEIKIGKLDTTVTVDVEALPPVSVQYIVAYGLTQCLNDAHASVARKNFSSDEAFTDAVLVKIGKRLAQIESGDVPGARVSRPKQTAAEMLAAMPDEEIEAILEARKAAKLAAAA